MPLPRRQLRGRCALEALLGEEDRRRTQTLQHLSRDSPSPSLVRGDVGLGHPRPARQLRLTEARGITHLSERIHHEVLMYRVIQHRKRRPEASPIPLAGTIVTSLALDEARRLRKTWNHALRSEASLRRGDR